MLYHAHFGKNQVIGSGDIEHNIIFLYKFSVFLSAVTFKIRSRSQCSNQGFSMSKCYINANFGRNKIIISGDIEHNITFLSEFKVFCLQ